MGWMDKTGGIMQVRPSEYTYVRAGARGMSTTILYDNRSESSTRAMTHRRQIRSNVTISRESARSRAAKGKNRYPQSQGAHGAKAKGNGWGRGAATVGRPSEKIA